MVFKGGVCKREMNLLADMPGQGIIGQCSSVVEYKADACNGNICKGSQCCGSACYGNVCKGNI
jgi:hypothetical protein